MPFILAALWLKKPQLFRLYFFVQAFYVGVCIGRVVIFVYYLIVGSSKSGEPPTSPAANDGTFGVRNFVDLMFVLAYMIFAISCYIVVGRAKEAVEVEQGTMGGRKSEEEGLA